jgi:outer membrane immunogenic protein
MKKTLLTSTAILLIGGPALAADLVPVVDYVPPPATPVFDWDGFYVGVHGGFGGDRFDYPWSLGFGDPTEALAVVRAPAPELPGWEDVVLSYGGEVPGSFDITSSGFFAGGQAGFNWQFAPHWLAGVEADIAWSGIKGELGASLDDIGSLRAGSSVDWFGTVRGRLGYVEGPLLVYGTGGFAYGGVESYFVDGAGKTSTSTTATGWTAGGGLEFMVSPNVSVKTEYLYVDLGSQDLLGGISDGPDAPDLSLVGKGDFFSASLQSQTHFHTLKAGLNVHLGEPNSQYAMPAPPTYDWNGFYAGLHGGYGGNKVDYPWYIDGSGADIANGLDFAFGKSVPAYLGRAFDGLLAYFQGLGDDGISGSFDLTSSGFFGGGQVGFNWQPAPNWLIGIEADIAASAIKGELGADIAEGFLGVRAGTQVNWFGTVRGRAGLIHGPLLLYGTGGFAYGGVESYITPMIFYESDTISTSTTATGWTAGGGFEYMLNPNLSFKTEYLYVDLGSQNLYSADYFDGPEDGIGTISVGLDSKTAFHTVKAGFNVHF